VVCFGETVHQVQHLHCELLCRLEVDRHFGLLLLGFGLVLQVLIEINQVGQPTLSSLLAVLGFLFLILLRNLWELPEIRGQ
jgi:hypothetical protein